MTGHLLYTEEDVELVADALNDPDRFVGEHDARRILAALSSANRLLPPGSDVREEWGTRRWWPDETDGYRDVVEPNERVAREVFEWRLSARTELILHTVITTPWSRVELRFDDPQDSARPADGEERTDG